MSAMSAKSGSDGIAVLKGGLQKVSSRRGTSQLIGLLACAAEYSILHNVVYLSCHNDTGAMN